MTLRQHVIERPERRQTCLQGIPSTQASVQAEASDLRQPRVLFLQATEPAAYPPLMHASMLMAEAGWEVTFLSAPVAGQPLALPSHPRVKVQAIRTRPSHVMRSIDYALYTASSADLLFACGPMWSMRRILSGLVPGCWLRGLLGLSWSIMSTTVLDRGH